MPVAHPRVMATSIVGRISDNCCGVTNSCVVTKSYDSKNFQKCLLSEPSTTVTLQAEKLSIFSNINSRIRVDHWLHPIIRRFVLSSAFQDIFFAQEKSSGFKIWPVTCTFPVGKNLEAHGKVRKTLRAKRETMRFASPGTESDS